MLKKTIKYVDYNGVEREEDHYFNLNKAELAKMEMSVEGGLSAKLNEMLNKKDYTHLINIFDEVICKSYGQKSEDGKRFVKSEAILEEFKQSEAYSELFYELSTNPDAANEFFTGIIPVEARPNTKLPETANK